MKKIYTKYTLFFWIGIIILLSVPVVLPLFHNGFFVSDDGEWMIIRLSAFFQSLREGQFPVRWLGRLNNGYGYPVANFMYPGFLYLGSLIHLLGFGYISTIKIIFGLSLVSSAIFTLLWLRKRYSYFSAGVAALFYLYMPYHIFDTYTRGSIGEVLAMAIAPFILWQIERRSLVLSSLGIGFLILSHNTLSLFFLPLIAIYTVLSEKDDYKKGLLFALTTTGLGLGLSCFFWLPALGELSYTRFGTTQVTTDYQQYFSTLTLVGVSTMVIFLATVWLVIKQCIVQGKKHSGSYILPAVLTLIGIVALVLSSQYAGFLWIYLPISLVQFPFRLLSVVALSGAMCCAWLLDNGMDKKRYVLGGVIVLILFISAGRMLIHDIQYLSYTDDYYSTNMSTTTVADEYMPRDVQHVNNWDSRRVATDIRSIEYLVSKSHKLIFTTNEASRSSIVINTVYFPGWSVYSNTLQTPVVATPNTGLIGFEVPAGKQLVEVVFQRTPIRWVAEIISLVSIVAIGYLLIYKYIGTNPLLKGRGK